MDMKETTKRMIHTITDDKGISFCNNGIAYVQDLYICEKHNANITQMNNVLALYGANIMPSDIIEGIYYCNKIPENRRYISLPAYVIVSKLFKDEDAIRAVIKKYIDAFTDVSNFETVVKNHISDLSTSINVISKSSIGKIDERFNALEKLIKDEQKINSQLLDRIQLVSDARTALVPPVTYSNKCIHKYPNGDSAIYSAKNNIKTCAICNAKFESKEFDTKEDEYVAKPKTDNSKLLEELKNSAKGHNDCSNSSEWSSRCSSKISKYISCHTVITRNIINSFIYKIMNSKYGIVWDQEKKEFKQKYSGTGYVYTLAIVGSKEILRSLYESILDNIINENYDKEIQEYCNKLTGKVPEVKCDSNKNKIQKNTKNISHNKEIISKVIRDLAFKLHDKSNHYSNTYYTVYKKLYDESGIILPTTDGTSIPIYYSIAKNDELTKKLINTAKSFMKLDNKDINIVNQADWRKFIKELK